VKNSILHKFILIVAAFCLFFNSIGVHYFSHAPSNSKNLNELQVSCSDEIKSSDLLSFIDSEERSLEFENEKSSEKDGDNGHLIAFLEQQLIAVYINDFNLNSIVNHAIKHAHNLPLYIQFENFRL